MSVLAISLVLLLSVGAVASKDCVDTRRFAETRSTLAETPGWPEPAIVFVENVGQANSEVRYYAVTPTGVMSITDGGHLVYGLPVQSSGSAAALAVLSERLLGLDDMQVIPVKESGTRISYFRGSQQSGWHADLPGWSEMCLRGPSSGLEVRLVAHPAHVEKLFIVPPGFDLDRLRIAVTGCERLELQENGQLTIETEVGSFSLTRPVAYQTVNDERRSVTVTYRLQGNNYGFRVGDYDHNRPLVIDPILSSTYFGGSGEDGFLETPLVRDAAGNIFVAGRTNSTDLPVTPGAYDTSHVTTDYEVFVAKFTSDLQELLACTYLGGSGADAEWPGAALAVDAQGNVFVAGKTSSSDFPVTLGAYDTQKSGSYDAFISKLSNDLTTLSASTFLGGFAEERYVQLDVDADDNVYVVGSTASPDFPYTPGAYDTAYSPGGTLGMDAFVSKLSGDLTTLLGSTFLGTFGDDCSEAIKVDEQGYAYITGWTSSSTFPTPNGRYTSHGGGYWDAFVSRFNSDLTELLSSTFLGGEEWDFGYGLTLDDSGLVYVTGHTASTANFPKTDDAFDTTYSGGAPNYGDDAFVTCFGPQLDTLMASTYLGGSGWEIGMALGVGDDGRVYVSGITTSGDLVLVPGAFDTTCIGAHVHYREAFLTVFDDCLTSCLASSYLGGSSREILGAMIVEPEGTVYLCGGTSSTDFPVTADAYDTSFNGGAFEHGGDLFVAKIRVDFDVDSDGVLTAVDNCPTVPNADQADRDLDGYGDLCDECTDTDADGYGDPGFPASTCELDNCPDIANPGQLDSDQDGVGDTCDNCPQVYNPQQLDDDQDGIGNACEYICGDADGNGIVNISDAVYLIAYIFGGGPEPEPLLAGDVDCNEIVNISDAVYLITYIFAGGPQPCAECPEG